MSRFAFAAARSPFTASAIARLLQRFHHPALVAELLADVGRARVLLDRIVELAEPLEAVALRVARLGFGSEIAGAAVQNERAHEVIVDGRLHLALQDRRAAEQEPRARVLHRRS